MLCNTVRTLEDVAINYDMVGHKERAVVIPRLPNRGLILIVGSSGSGKSTILRSLFPDELSPLEISDGPLLTNFSSIENGERLLKAFGLLSIPTWFRPFKMLSNGEQHRAECALRVDRGFKCIDEFTSVVDRPTAKSLSVALRRFCKDQNIIVATCHHDVEEWLCPDVIYDTDSQKFIDRRYLQRPPIRLTIKPSTVENWVRFKKHHYLTDGLHPACHCYIATIDDDVPVGFVAVIHGTGRDVHSYWRESRLVVLPEFQSLGIGKVLSEEVAKIYVEQGKRYFSKTAHPSLGEYRNKSPLWRATITNQKSRQSYLKDGVPRNSKNYGVKYDTVIRDANRICYSHEYIGRKEETT